jgi:hypothetical protein
MGDGAREPDRLLEIEEYFGQLPVSVFPKLLLA